MRGCVGEDDPAPDLLLEPRMLNRRTGDAIWIRVVDVEKALPQRPYGDRGEIVFAVEGDDVPMEQRQLLARNGRNDHGSAARPTGRRT